MKPANKNGRCVEKTESSGGRRMQGPENDESNYGGVNHSIAASDVKSRIIFILENASLRKGIVRKKRKILSSSEDADFLAKNGGKDLSEYRPDIVFEALRGILDSPLNNAGLIGAVYVKTDSGLLFEVKTHTRIPRTCARFSGVILDLMDKSSVSAGKTGETLLRVLEGPVTRHIPSNARVIGLSYSSNKKVDIEDYVSTISDDSDLVFVIGAMVHGKVSKDYTDDYISVSDYRMSARGCVELVCAALEQKWKINYPNK